MGFLGDFFAPALPLAEIEKTISNRQLSRDDEQTREGLAFELDLWNARGELVKQKPSTLAGGGLFFIKLPCD